LRGLDPHPGDVHAGERPASLDQLAGDQAGRRPRTRAKVEHALAALQIQTVDSRLVDAAEQIAHSDGDKDFERTGFMKGHGSLSFSCE
jgi:hypothetical protein